MNLEAALRDLADRDPRVRAQAADGLGRADGGERAQAIAALSAAAVDEHASVRYAALLSLGELGAAGAVEIAAERLTDGEPLVREAAAIALGELALAAAGEPPDAATNAAPNAVVERAWGALAEALGYPQPEVRFQAIASLAQLDAARAAPLVRAALDDVDAKVRAQACAALGDARDRGSADALARLLDDAPDVRHEAALALARMGDRRGAAWLVEALDHRDLALDAAQALAELGVAGDERAHAALARVLGRLLGDPLVKVRAAEALARSGDARGRRHLERAARARRDDVRGLAQTVLSELPK
ncbi:MAG TPA: HEAT repeat domain-containing protein [Polyangia bacterium]|nr:HEAT repeat domain-containing protein [Polyangia bacterium]